MNESCEGLKPPDWAGLDHLVCSAPHRTATVGSRMNSNQIRKALMEMGFQIISPESQTQLKLTHGHCQGILSVDPNPQAFGIALNFLSQNQAATLEWARAVAVRAMTEAQAS